VSRSIPLEAIFSVSDNGLLLFQTGAASDDSRLVWLDRQGQLRGTIGEPAWYNMPALSHDQTRIAVQIFDSDRRRSDIWVLEVERGTRTRLTFDSASDFAAAWSADDRKIHFSSSRSGRGDIYSKSSSGVGAAERVYASEVWGVLMSLSPDGTTGWLVLDNTTAKTGFDIFRLDLESHEAEVFEQTPFAEGGPIISPDGHWLLYESSQSGRGEVYVQSLRGDGGRWQISEDGGWRGRWTRDGRGIVFEGLDGQIMAVEVTLTPTFSAGAPEALFDPHLREGLGPQYDVTLDGNRFLVNQSVEQPAVEPLTLVLNWTSELEQ